MTLITATNGTLASISTFNGSTVTLTLTAPIGLASLTAPIEDRWITIAGTTTSPASIDGTYRAYDVSGSNFKIDAVVNANTGASPATVTILENDFRDIKTCFDLIINNLNNDTGASFSNYNRVNNDTLQEAVILSINKITKTVTFNIGLDWTSGAVTLYKHILSQITYSPQTMGDPLGMKHLRESTMMFQNKAFTKAKMSFSTDLLPEFISIDFNGDGNGIFGHSSFFGSGNFGGSSNGAPFRTMIPLNCQRCRYISIDFQHGVARETYAIFGITITGEVGLTTKAYR